MSSPQLKDAEKSTENQSYLSQLYTPTRVKEQHEPAVEEKKVEVAETLPVPENSAENYMQLIQSTNVKKAKKSDVPTPKKST